MDLMSYLTGDGAAFKPTAAQTQAQLNWRPRSAYMNPAQPKKAGLLGVDPLTWLQIAGAMAQGAQGGGWGTALQGTASAFQDRKAREDEAGRSDAQQRAMMAMQAGDMDGALRILSSAKGLEGQAMSTQLALKQREQERQDALRKPIIAPPGSRGLRMNEAGDGFDEIFDVPDPSAVAHGTKIHAWGVDDTGRARAIMGDASVRDLGFNAQDSFGTVDVGGVPSVVSRRSGAGAPLALGSTPSAPLGPGASPGPGAPSASPVTARDVGSNKATIENIVDTQKAETQAKIDLPTAILSAQNAIGVIDGMLSQPGFDSRYGMGSLGGLVPPLKPGGEGANAQAYIDQVKGQAFMQGIKALAGTGPVANKEGESATKAYTRLMNQNMSPEEARKAALEMREAAENLVLLGRIKAGQPIDYSKLSQKQLELIASMPAGEN